MMCKRYNSALVASFWVRSFPFESHFYDPNNNQYPSWAKTRPQKYFVLEGCRKDTFGHDGYKCTTILAGTWHSPVRSGNACLRKFPHHFSCERNQRLGSRWSFKRCSVGFCFFLSLFGRHGEVILYHHHGLPCWFGAS